MKNGGNPVKIFAFFIYILNLLTFAVMGADKHAAKTNHRRVPEKTLFLMALLGGGLGGMVGMLYFHHKTKHWYFRYGFPIIAVLQCACFLWVLTQA